MNMCLPRNTHHFTHISTTHYPPSTFPLFQMEDADRRIAEIQRILTKQSKSGGGGDDSDSDSDDDDLEDHEGLQSELDELNQANQTRQGKLDDYEKNKKWNVDNICHVVEERTIVNKKVDAKFNAETGYAVDDDKAAPPKTDSAEGSSKESNETKKVTKEAAPTAKMDNLSMNNDGVEKKKKDAAPASAPAPAAAPTEKAAAAASKPSPAGPDREKVAMMDYHEFTERYADLCEEFMKIRDLDRSREFLLQHGNVLLQENASNFLLLATLEDEMNGFHDKMRQTARQSQIISNIAELAKSLQSHPGNVINPFFKRLEEKQHLSGFLEGSKLSSRISRSEPSPSGRRSMQRGRGRPRRPSKEGRVLILPTFPGRSVSAPAASIQWRSSRACQSPCKRRSSRGRWTDSKRP